MPTQNVDELLVLTEGNWESYRNDRAESVFERGTEVADEYGVEIETRLLDGEVERAIVEAGDEFDWIVKGSHGREGVARVHLGNNAERLVRRAPIPVIVVR